MKQAIAGVVPTDEEERTVTVIWPSITMYGPGRGMGFLFDLRWPDVYIFRIGNLFALMLAPVGMLLYLSRVAPIIATRYRITNRRIIVERGSLSKEERSLALDRFDSIEIDVRWGQRWFDAGDLVFQLDGVETFRLPAISRPKAFRAICMKSHQSFVGVKQALHQQLAHA